jgi:hypothetical protein
VRNGLQGALRRAAGCGRAGHHAEGGRHASGLARERDHA